MSELTSVDVRLALLAGTELALLDVRNEHEFAQAHPLFAAQMAHDRIEIEAPIRLPRQDVQIVVYDDGEGLAELAARKLGGLGYSRVVLLKSNLAGWREAGYEIFQDVNSYCKAFGELVEARKHTPSLSAVEVEALLKGEDKVTVVDVRRYDEYNTMNIPGSVSIPSAELAYRLPAIVDDPDHKIIINCAGRTRSIIATQSVINFGLTNSVAALRNGTIGWTLEGQELEMGQTRRAESPGEVDPEMVKRTAEVAYRCGVKVLSLTELAGLIEDRSRTNYLFDVRLPEEFARGHLPGFRNVQGGQLIQETDHYAPVRGARIVLSDEIGMRASMTASWLAQMGWDAYVVDAGAAEMTDTTFPAPLPPIPKEQKYKRPYEGTDNAREAMQAYLDWEFGLVDQLAKDATHGFVVV